MCWDLFLEEKRPPVVWFLSTTSTSHKLPLSLHILGGSLQKVSVEWLKQRSETQSSWVPYVSLELLTLVLATDIHFLSKCPVP